MSKIQWTDKTWNPTTGCSRVSAGCVNCYAVPMTKRLGAMGQPKYVGLTVNYANGLADFTGEVRCHEDTLTIPMKWRKPQRVFVNSMSDLFHPDVPFDFIDKVFAVMALCPQHTFQILTKRPERMAEYLNDDFGLGGNSYRVVMAMKEYVAADKKYRGQGRSAWMRGRDHLFPLPNVWFGTSVENQPTADKRIPELLRCPAAVRFLSVEPLLGPVDLQCVVAECEYTGTDHRFNALSDDLAQGRWFEEDGPETRARRVDWVIVGGESGPGARPCDVAWVRSIVEQCREAAVPVFVKQLGARVEMSFDEWNDLTSGGADGSDRFTIHSDDRDRGIWKPNNPKGGDPAEWPADLRVQKFPGGEA